MKSVDCADKGYLLAFLKCFQCILWLSSWLCMSSSFRELLRCVALSKQNGITITELTKKKSWLKAYLLAFWKLFNHILWPSLLSMSSRVIKTFRGMKDVSLYLSQLRYDRWFDKIILTRGLLTSFFPELSVPSNSLHTQLQTPHSPLWMEHCLMKTVRYGWELWKKIVRRPWIKVILSNQGKMNAGVFKTCELMLSESET